MKRSFLARIRSNGLSYLGAGLLLLAGIPAYQSFVLAPLEYNRVLALTSVGNSIAYFSWINGHQLSFLLYRVLILAAFSLLLSLPFTLFRIIIAQEIMGQEEREAEELYEEDDEYEEEYEDVEDSGKGEEDTDNPEDEVVEDEDEESSDGMPPYVWRGKGFAVIAAWSGYIGLICYIIGTIGSSLYLVSVSNSVTINSALSSSNILLISIFSVLTNTIGVGLLALSTLFFGVILVRAGTKLWPTTWVLFGALALGVAALFSGSAVSVANAPASGQAPLTAPAILLFGLWVLWLGFMLVRLKPQTMDVEVE